MTNDRHGDDRTRIRRGDMRQFNLLVVALYPIFLAVTLVRFATGRLKPGAGQRPRSIFEEARVSASTTIALAFMG